MCGIAGWINFKNDIRDNDKYIEKMIEGLSPRGPDESGIWKSNNALIGHRRLAVVDLKGGKQPMQRIVNNNTYVISYNGELYNTKELKDTLISYGHKFEENSDTEVLLASYIKWGEKCVDYLNGIYAFAVWEKENKKLFLARDRFGVKPLFYAVRDSSIIFASELKALLQNPLIEAKLDKVGLNEIITLGPARTPGNGIFKDVLEVKPCEYIIFEGEKCIKKEYWRLKSIEHEDSVEKTIERVRDLVIDAVERQLISDVPLCTFLSGGLDFSAITAISSNKLNKDNKLLDTFSIDYIDNDKYFKKSLFQPSEDAPFIELMSKEFNTFHHNIIIDTPELVAALYDATLARDLPGMADVDSSLFIFCKEVKKHATVALSGECADEIFGGYPWFYRQELLKKNTFPWSSSVDNKLTVFSKEITDYLKPKAYMQEAYINTIEDVPIAPWENETEKRRREMFYLNLKWFMITLLNRKDRMSMANGLEVRVPFCDHNLVQYVWNVPWKLKMLEGREKGLLRKALEGILPEDILYRKKSPYPKTYNPTYTKAVTKIILDIVHDASSPILGLIDKKRVIDMSKEISEINKPWYGQLMSTPQLFAYLIQLDFWMKAYKITI